ncbi:unnamed protein product [Brassica oleracea var. botrytis]
MSLAIKLLVLFFIIDLSVAKYITNKDSIVKQDNQDVYMSHIDYSNFFKQKIEGWQREADERYPSIHHGRIATTKVIWTALFSYKAKLKITYDIGRS